VSSLTNLERIKIEKLFGMSTGYVLDFSNRTFHEFILEVTGKNIYEDGYGVGGDSKANRLRIFWKIEPDRGNGILLDAMIDRMDTMNLVNGREITEADSKLVEACRTIAKRLNGSFEVADLDAIKPIGPQREFDILSRTVRESIVKGEPEAALDRLHTYMTKYLREKCNKNGIVTEQTHPPHSLLGSYIKGLRTKGIELTRMSEHILKSAIGSLEAFNDIRNNRSLAHDNELLEKAESMYIVKRICSLVQLLDEIDPANTR
jgi:hypothetical protein